MVTWLAPAVLWAALLIALGFDIRARIRNGEQAVAEQADHAKCIAHIASVTSNKFVAARLRDLAKRYDTVEAKSEMDALARGSFVLGGPSLPAIWLNFQAELLDPLEFDLNEVAL